MKAWGLRSAPFFCMSGGWGGGFGVSFSLPSGSSSSLPIVSIVVPFAGLNQFWLGSHKVTPKKEPHIMETMLDNPKPALNP